jgi:hypothetical protein
MHTQKGIKERFLRDLRECAEIMLKAPKAKLDGRVSAVGHVC